MKNITTIIFDFGGVIFNIDFDKVDRAFADLGLKNFKDYYSKTKADFIFQQLEEGRFSEEEFYEAFRKRTGCNLDNRQIKDAWNTLLVDYRTEALKTIRKLKSKFKIFLLSNTNSIHLRAFRKIYNHQIGEGTLEQHFHKVFYSHEIGYRKPGPEIYQYVLHQNKLVPSECLFIDDSLQNIEAAKAQKIYAIHLTDEMTIERLQF